MGAFDDLIPAGGTAVAEPPDPFADLIPKAKAAPTPFDDLIPVTPPAKTPTPPPARPTSSPVMDALRRVPAAIASATAQAAGGILSAVDALQTFREEGIDQDTGEKISVPAYGERFAGAQEDLRELQDRAAGDYGVDPARDKDIASKIISGAGSLVPIVASGPFAPVTGGALMGESVRQEAEAAGATPNQQAAAFTLGGVTGVASEFMLGIPALIKSARATGADDAAIKSLTRQAVGQGLKSAGREATQEAIEQTTNNLIANTLVSYDPERGTFEGVTEAAVLGAAIGGPLGAVVQTAATLDQRAQTAPISDEQRQKAQVAEARAKATEPIIEENAAAGNTLTAEALAEVSMASTRPAETVQEPAKVEQKPAGNETTVAPKITEAAPETNVPAQGTEAATRGSTAAPDNPVPEVVPVTPDVTAPEVTPSSPAPRQTPAQPQAATAPAGAGEYSLTPEQNTRINELADRIASQGGDQVRALNEAERIVASANTAGKPVDWQMVAQGASSRGFSAPTESLNEARETLAEPIEQVREPGPQPDRQMVESEMRAVATEAVKGLPKGEQAVMRLAMEGKSNPEIAELTGMTLASVTTTKSKAFKKIQKSVYALGISPDNKFAKWLVENGKRLFTAEGNLPTETFQRWVERTGEVKAESRQIAYATRDLYAGLRKEFGISKADEITGGFEKVPREFVEAMNEALLGNLDINSVPESIRDPLQRMRQHIDTLSQRMLDDGIVPERLRTVVADNLGVYMTRSYRVFDDPKWAESIPIEVRNRARDFILSDLRRDNPAATSENANAVMQAMLQDWKDAGSGVLIKGGKLGSKDLTSFIARKDIPEVIRDLMGEYKSPVINYARSVTKMAHLIANQHFLNDVRAQGMGKFLFEDGQQPTTHSALIAADESDVMAPLNGLRTTPEIAEAFREFGKSKTASSAVGRLYFALSGIAKAGKTVGSVMTQARNLFGQTYFWLMNGHFDVRHSVVAVKSIMADLGATNSKKARETYSRYLKLGVVDQSTRANELRDTIRDAGLNDADIDRLDTQGHILKSLKRYTLDAATSAYQVSDDLGKIVGFENELARLRKINPDKPIAELETEAAQRIRDTYPTYSMVPEWVKQFQKQPVLGPFVSFAYESFRTAFHNLRYTAEDLQSANSEARKAGAQRLAGQLTVLAGGYALSTASRALLGLTADDEDDLRRFMPRWDKNSQLMFTGKEGGKATYINLSYANPYSYLTDPVNAVITGVRNADDLLPIMAKSFGELLRPFTSENIITNAVLDIARNTTETGRPIYNPQDTPDEKVRAVLAHVGEALEPGTVTRLRKKIIPSLTGEQTRYGTALSPTNEIASELTGFKTQTLDYEQGLSFKAYRFRVDDEDAEAIFRNAAFRRGTVQESEITDSYQRSNEAKFKLWKDMFGDIQAAKRRGVSDKAISETLSTNGISKADTTQIMAGKFAPYVVSDEGAKKLRRLNRILPAGVSDEAQRARSLVLTGSFKP